MCKTCGCSSGKKTKSKAKQIQFQIPALSETVAGTDMSEHDVMVLAGHTSFVTTHEFYLTVADDLVHRSRAATAQGLRQKLVRFGTGTFLSSKKD
jgi:hypothetical protein